VDRYDSTVQRRTVKALAIVLLVIGVIAVMFALVYVGVRASSLPSWMPGYRHPVRTKRGRIITYGQLKRYVFVLVLVGAGSLGLAWWLAYRYEPVD
jgi:hypothetical protein